MGQKFEKEQAALHWPKGVEKETYFFCEQLVIKNSDAWEDL
jgi:hypothetical protein